MPDPRGVALAVALAALAWDGGGYLPRAWGWAGLAAGTAALLALAAERRRGGVGGMAPLGGVAAAWLALLAASAAWTLGSALWSQSPPSSIAEAQRAVVVVGAALVAVAVFRRLDGAVVAGAVLAAATAVSAANLLHRVGGYDDRLIGAAAEPVAYDNALALLAVLGVLVALGLCVSGTQAAEPRVRVLAAVSVPVNGLVVVLAASVGAWGALVVGAAAAAVAAGGRKRAVGVAMLAAVVVAGVASFGGHERERYWGVALDAAADHPVAGTGAGTFWQLWLREREVPLSARDAHGLYVETLAEQGAIGLALLLAALVVPLVAAARGPRRPFVVGAYAAFVAALALDWHWELSGVAAAGTLLGGALLLDARRARADELVFQKHKVASAGAAVAAVVVVAISVVTLAEAALLGRAREAFATGRHAAAADAARDAARVAPWAAEPWLVAAEAESAAGDAVAARRAAREGLERDANDWRLWLELARSSEGAERERALARARSLNPLGPFAA